MHPASRARPCFNSRRQSRRRARPFIRRRAVGRPPMQQTATVLRNRRPKSPAALGNGPFRRWRHRSPFRRRLHQRWRLCPPLRLHHHRRRRFQQQEFLWRPVRRPSRSRSLWPVSRLRQRFRPRSSRLRRRRHNLNRPSRRPRSKAGRAMVLMPTAAPKATGAATSAARSMPLTPTIASRVRRPRRWPSLQATQRPSP